MYFSFVWSTVYRQFDAHTHKHVSVWMQCTIIQVCLFELGIDVMKQYIFGKIYRFHFIWAGWKRQENRTKRAQILCDSFCSEPYLLFSLHHIHIAFCLFVPLRKDPYQHHRSMHIVWYNLCYYPFALSGFNWKKLLNGCPSKRHDKIVCLFVHLFVCEENAVKTDFENRLEMCQC